MGLTPRPHAVHLQFSTKLLSVRCKEKVTVLLPYSSMKRWYVGDKLQSSSIQNKNYLWFGLQAMISDIETKGYYT